ncbi:MAG: hypothetical protein CMM08_03905 [Rhodospirillaceae bacterium]|jgi:acetolactate synthase-1/2/3 large subunit|nr:hypothetical protein [Rhodospirillaceae bacterium]MDP6623171.1 thiamine pyrophosphate-binding protein [Alphaproteobacteria bacterium]
MAAFDTLAQEMAGHGPVFGIPGGGTSLELLDALERQGTAFHLSHHEAAAAIMAGTMGRLSGRAGLALTIKGPGLANLVPGLAACWFESFPLVALCEALPAGVDWSQRHKGIDHATLVAAVSKGRYGLGEDGGEDSFSNAAALAAAEVPGPVVLELVAGEVAAEPGGFGALAYESVIAAVEKAERPLVIAGSLALRAGWTMALAGLEVPVFCTAAAKGVIDETAFPAAGVYTGVGLEKTPESCLLPAADLVVGLGLRPQEVLAAKPFACDAVNLDDAASSLVFDFAASDGCHVAEEVFAALAEKSWGQDLLSEALANLDAHLGTSQPARALAAVERRFDEVRAVFDTGYFCTIGEHAWRPRKPAHCLMAGQGRTMGTSIPMAIAAALHDRLPTVTVVGDGGIGMHVAELKLAAAEKLPLLVLLISDGGFGSVRTRALADGLTETPLLISEPSWLAALEGLGLPGTRVEGEAALGDALDAWDPASGPAYIEFPCDPEAYQAMVAGLR